MRRQKLAKLCHSKSDDRRRSFDRFRRESQSISRYSLNFSTTVEGCAPEYELKYFTAKSLETEDSKGDISDESRVMDFEDQEGSHISPEAIQSVDALLEEPELENLTEPEGGEISTIKYAEEKGKKKENTRNLKDAADEIETYADDNESDSSRKEK